MDEDFIKKLEQFKAEAKEFAASVEQDCSGQTANAKYDNGNEYIEEVLNRQADVGQLSSYLDRLREAKEGLFEQRETLLQQMVKIEQELDKVEEQERFVEKQQVEETPAPREFAFEDLDKRIDAELENLHEEDEELE